MTSDSVAIRNLTDAEIDAVQGGWEYEVAEAYLAGDLANGYTPGGGSSPADFQTPGWYYNNAVGWGFGYYRNDLTREVSGLFVTEY